ncbi:MAG: hypothetical protein LBS26_05670 [Campylobacteraceae bacterium]|jgi:hypothetical protein|nr:hypothetical protein [Campylobacteraceae bacterium]
MIKELIKLQEDIYNYEMEENDGYWADWSPKINFYKAEDWYELTYFGDGYDDGYNFAFAAFIDLIIKHSSKIKSLLFTGADEGANGTKNWDFTRLINSGAVFENLESFRVKLTDTGDHNTSIIAASYDEDGQIAALVAKMPILRVLQVPSAPNDNFFKLKDLSLQQLIVQAGYNTQDFIKNLSACDNMKNLYALDWTDILDDVDSIGTKYEQYKELFSSRFFDTQTVEGRKIRFHFTLRENKLTTEQLQELIKIKNIQLLYIRAFSGQYAR